MRVKAAWVAIALAGVAVLASAAFPQSAPAFRAFLERIRPEAEARGVSRATFEAATADLTPDLSLPDLITLGREQPRSEQAEFVQAPAQYLAERTLENLAMRGRRLWEQHRVILTASKNASACRRQCCWRSGDARPPTARSHAGVYWPAQRALSRRVCLGAEADRGGAPHASTTQEFLRVISQVRLVN